MLIAEKEERVPRNPMPAVKDLEPKQRIFFRSEYTELHERAISDQTFELMRRTGLVEVKSE